MHKEKALMLLGFIVVAGCLSRPIQAKNDGQRDISLTEFRVDTCLFGFLSSLVSSNRQIYQSADYYYSFELGVIADRRQLYIAPEKWKSARMLDYMGYIEVNGMLFLCKGNLSKDSLFYKTNNTKHFELVLSENELGRMQDFGEPSMEGTLKICPGRQLDVSVFTKGRIDGYMLKE